MFTAEIAGIPIGIDNNFGTAEWMCRDYITDKPPLFTVSATAEELMREGGVSAHAEELCLYRKIALGMMEFDAFLMHAAVIDVDGQGLAFAGKSGAGKTTRVRMWQKALGERVKVVNGDKPILRFTGGDLYAYGTPWRGKEGMGENRRVPMRYVCFIERSGSVTLRRLEPEEAAARLMHQMLVPRDAGQLERFAALTGRFAETVSFFLLRGDRDAERPGELWERMKRARAAGGEG